MITTGILKAFLAIVGWFVSLIPTMSLPSWVSSIHDTLTQAATSAAALGNLLPLSAVIGGATFVISCYGLAWAIRLVRWIQSSITGGGGQ